MNAESRPNILVIMSDQHSPYFLGARDERAVQTPNLDRLAKRGIRFDNAHCANPLCLPSRMSFLTSRFSSDTQTWNHTDFLASNIPTFVHHLNQAGYETNLCGRMHFNGPDQRHGFQNRILDDCAFDIEPIPNATKGNNVEGVKIAGPGRTSYQRFDQAATETCCDFLSKRDPNQSNDPFFLMLGYVLPHCPYICPKKFYDQYDGQIDLPTLPDGYHENLHQGMKDLLQERGTDGLTDEQVRVARTAYFGMVTQMDQYIGEVLEALEKSPYADNTMVVYVSDHGEMAGEHRLWSKTNFLQQSVGVPMIVSWPKAFAQGRVVKELVSLLDIGPTLVDLVGGEPMPLARGHSFRGFLENDGQIANWSNTVYAELASENALGASRMVRRGAWKLNYFAKHDLPQLFNLEEDPQEFDDRASDPACAEIRKELEALVHENWSAEFVDKTRERIAIDMRTIAPNFEAVVGLVAERWQAPPNCNIFPDV